MAGTKNPRTAACAGRAPAGDALGKTTAAKTCRATNSTLVLPRLRLTGVARQIQHGRPLDGQARRSQYLCRRLFRAADVRVVVQNARICAARLYQSRARHPRSADHAAHRTSGETALTRDALRQRGSPGA